MGKNKASNSAAKPSSEVSPVDFFFFLINFMAVCSITRNSHSGTQCQQVACECVSLFCATIFKKKYVLFCFVWGNGSGFSFYLFFPFFSFVIVVLHLTEGGKGAFDPSALCISLL